VQSLRYPSSWHLSRERAQAVAAALVDAGLPAARVRAEGRAETEPRVANDSPTARARNRRVEVQLLLPRPET
jgi:type VI secretion system protein ImpK